MKNLFLVIFLSLLWNCTNTQSVSDNPSKEDEVKTDLKPVIQESSYPLSYVMGQFDPATHPDFVKIPLMYADREGLFLHKDTYSAFQKMHAAALKDDVKLVIRSATRNFASQKGIWEAKWKGTRKIENGKDASIAYPDPKQRALKILEYSSMPGSSRHHWGSDIDLNNFNNSWFESGEGLKIYNWLLAHGAEFGFCQPYTAKGQERPNGYNEERWHWSYMPLSQGLTIKAKQNLKDEMIGGFTGSETAIEIGIVEKYVLGVNSDCLLPRN